MNDIHRALWRPPAAWTTAASLLLAVLVAGWLGADRPTAPLDRVADRLGHFALALVTLVLTLHMTESGLEGAPGWPARGDLPRPHRILGWPIRLAAASWAIALPLLLLVSWLPYPMMANLALVAFVVYLPGAAVVAALYDLGDAIAEPLAGLRIIQSCSAHSPVLLPTTLVGSGLAWLLGAMATTHLGDVGYGLAWGGWLYVSMVIGNAWGLNVYRVREAIGIALPAAPTDPDPKRDALDTDREPPPTPPDVRSERRADARSARRPEPPEPSPPPPAPNDEREFEGWSGPSGLDLDE